MMTDPVRSILVVDDEADTCANLADIFRDLGFHVDVALSGSDALEFVRRKNYDVALLDLKMGDMDGLQLCQRIRQSGAGTVAMIVTAFASEAASLAAQDVGAWRIVNKPVDPAKLLNLIDEALGQPPVLVIDDDPELCQTLAELLRDQGFRVSIATNLTEAARRLQESNLDVAIIDMRLPEGDGGDAVRMVRRLHPEARTVLITGYRDDTEEWQARLRDAGADAVCYKPFDVAALLQTVRHLAR